MQHLSNPLVSPQSASTASTYEQIMAVAKQLIQTYGYNGFSYADIAVRVSVRKATIHYYFPNKSDLARSVVIRYRESFATSLSSIDKQTDKTSLKLGKYVQMYRDVLSNSQNICLCGMLAAEYTTLPEDVCKEVDRFFSDNSKWLAKVIASLRKVQVKNSERPDPKHDEDDAYLLLSGLEGAMLLARTRGGVLCFDAIAKRLLKQLMLD